MKEEVHQLITAIKKGGSGRFDRLCEIYGNLIKSRVLSFLPACSGYGIEYDDLVQEAAMALYKAAMTYKIDQTKVTFGLYAKVCINHRLISVQRKLFRANKKPTKSTKPMRKYRRVFRDTDYAKVANKADCILSEFERDVFTMYLEGCSYKEIAEKLHKNIKSVDNAMFRIRKKLKDSKE